MTASWLPGKIEHWSIQRLTAPYGANAWTSSDIRSSP